MIVVTQENHMALADSTTLYDKHIAGLYFPHIKCNTTHFQDDIKCLVPDIKSDQMNCDCALVFDDDLSKAVDMKNNSSTDVSIIPKAAKNPPEKSISP